MGVTGLAPATTAIQAGALPGQPGQYSFPAIDSGKFEYGFDPNFTSKQYGGAYNAANTPVGATGGNRYSNTPGIVGGTILPPTSTSSVDINSIDLDPMPLD